MRTPGARAMASISSCKKTHTSLFFECFPYVCPEPALVNLSFSYVCREPVLAKWSFSVQNGIAKEMRFLTSSSKSKPAPSAKSSSPKSSSSIHEPPHAGEVTLPVGDRFELMLPTSADAALGGVVARSIGSTCGNAFFNGSFPLFVPSLSWQNRFLYKTIGFLVGTGAKKTFLHLLIRRPAGGG
eukprot:COSAG06_NODE_2368_length_6998_cov_3.945934_5_plen_184_part_00